MEAVRFLPEDRCHAQHTVTLDDRDDAYPCVGAGIPRRNAGSRRAPCEVHRPGVAQGLSLRADSLTKRGTAVMEHRRPLTTTYLTKRYSMATPSITGPAAAGAEPQPFEPLNVPASGKARKVFGQHAMDCLRDLVDFSQGSAYAQGIEAPPQQAADAAARSTPPKPKRAAPRKRAPAAVRGIDSAPLAEVLIRLQFFVERALDAHPERLQPLLARLGAFGGAPDSNILKSELQTLLSP